MEDNLFKTKEMTDNDLWEIFMDRVKHMETGEMIKAASALFGTRIWISGKHDLGDKVSILPADDYDLTFGEFDLREDP